MTINTPTPATARFLEVAGGRVAYDDTGGDGDLILGIPGMGDLRAQCSPMILSSEVRITQRHMCFT
jgi:hypothetical protein